MFDWFKKKEETKPKIKKRSFEAAKYTEFAREWAAWVGGTANDEISGNLDVLRARSRDAYNNDPVAKTYFQALNDQVIGDMGIQLNPIVRNKNGKIDKGANEIITTAFNQWSRSITTDGLSWVEALKLFTQCLKRDGEVLIKILIGPKYSSPNSGNYGFQLQFLDPEYLDCGYNDINRKTGNQIVSSVEIDDVGRPVGYWLFETHPNSLHRTNNTSNKRVFVSADYIIHAFEKNRPHAFRGVPALASSLINLKHLQDYIKSELINCKLSSMKLGFYTKSEEAEALTPYGIEDDEIDDEGVFYENLSPGTFSVLPPGYSVEPWDPKNSPNASLPAFAKVILRSVASSLGVSYFTLANDVEAANYSSLRIGLIQERETYKNIQRFVIEHFCYPVYMIWLSVALDLDNLLDLPASKQRKYESVEFLPKHWMWVDPQKELASIKTRLDYGLSSRSEIVRDMGRSYENVLSEIKEEEELAKSMGVEMNKLDNAIGNVMENNTQESDEEA